MFKKLFAALIASIIVSPFAQARLFPLSNPDQIEAEKEVINSIYQPMKTCWGWSCASSKSIPFTEDHWVIVDRSFAVRAQTPREERKQIQKAIAVMEKMIGEMNGETKYDKGAPNKQGRGQTDCVDESINTTRYLRFMAARGLLRFHNVDDIEMRLNIPWMPLLGQHFTATILDVKTSERYAVDSWWFDNGQLPVIQNLKNWKKRAKVTNTVVP